MSYAETREDGLAASNRLHWRIELDSVGIVAQIDLEISRLQQARALIVGESAGVALKGKRGRPKGSVNKTGPLKKAAKKTGRKLSPEGRKAIADAMKRRWAERKKQA